MYCKKIKGDSTVYAYDGLTYQSDNDADIEELYNLNKKRSTKLVVIGGVHGYEGTGIPTGQDDVEKGVTNFSRSDQDNKGLWKSIDFIYKSLAIYTTNGSDITEIRQEHVADLIKAYQSSGHIVLLSWCYSSVWAKNKVND